MLPDLSLAKFCYCQLLEALLLISLFKKQLSSLRAAKQVRSHEGRDWQEGFTFHQNVTSDGLFLNLAAQSAGVGGGEVPSG